MRAKTDLTQGPIFPALLKMTFPILIGMTAALFSNIVDGIFAGRLGLQASMAVLNYGFPIFYLLFAFFNGVSIGTTSNLARLIGAKKIDEAQNNMSQILWVNLAILAASVAIFPFILKEYLIFQKASAETQLLTHQFLTYVLIGMPFLLISLTLGGGLRAEGNMRALATSQMLGVISNLLMAPFFIFSDFNFLGVHWTGLNLGVKGAGLASSCSSFLTALYILRIYFSKKTQLRWILKPQWVNTSGIAAIFKVGIPSSISQLLIGLNWILMTRLTAHFGESAVAAIGIGGRLDLLSVFPALAIMTAVLTMVGQNYGAKKYDRVREAVRVGLLTGFIGIGGIGLIIHFAGKGIIGIFHPDAATQLSALHYLYISTWGFGLVGLNIVSSGAFQGLGRGLPFLLLTVLRLVGLTFPIAYFLSLHYQAYGVHYAPVIANFITAVIAVVWILTVTKRLKTT